MEVSIQHKAGNRVISTVKEKDKRLNMMIWGASGSGKTTLASTAPKPILFIQLDPDGTDCLGQQDGVFVLDISSEHCAAVKQIGSNEANPLSIDSFVKENGIKTIVLDSLTTLCEMALRYGITQVKGATMEMPTLQGYGRRNTHTAEAVGALLRYTAKNNINFILLAHEDSIQKDELTGAMFQTILVGGRLQEEIPIRISEVWHLADTGKGRVISVRATRMRKPMKSRMFLADKNEFTWDYNADTGEGTGIEDWYNAWLLSGGNKIPMPK